MIPRNPEITKRTHRFLINITFLEKNEPKKATGEAGITGQA
jgi:hypothetical protein